MNYVKGKFVWMMEHAGRHASCHEAQFAPTCCDEEVDLESLVCAHCGEACEVVLGLIVFIEGQAIALKRRPSVEDAQQLIRDYIDKEDKKAAPKPPNHPPHGNESEDPLAAKVQSIGWPGRAVELHEQENRKRKERPN